MLVGVVSFGEAGAYACESGNLRLGSSGGRTPQLSEQPFDAWGDVPRADWQTAFVTWGVDTAAP
jgi:hypothetical protein